MTRRSVRVDPQFFSDLDAQLGETRGPQGEPSSSDFLLLDLPTIADGTVVLVGIEIDFG